MVAVHHLLMIRQKEIGIFLKVGDNFVFLAILSCKCSS
jgi:hypothetical protein